MSDFGINDKLAEIKQLRDAKLHEEAHRLAVQLVNDAPNDVRARMLAAYTSDRLGMEHDSIVHYEIAWALGVPDGERVEFLLGYGSSLRNVGRNQEAVERLREALRERPESPALLAFLSLALLGSGNSAAAIATMLKSALLAARPGGFEGYERALGEYQQELDAKT